MPRARVPRLARWVVAASFAQLAACAPKPGVDRAGLSAAIERRTGVALRPTSSQSPTGPLLPPRVTVADGLEEDEAVAIALWNNQRFQADLAALGVARADLLEAGMIRNPLLTLLFPLGPKQLELTASVPLESLWQRPYRIAAAQAELLRVGKSLEGSGLLLVRDVKIAYAEVRLAKAKAALAQEATALLGRIAQIAEGRLGAGDTSIAEVTHIKADAEMAAIQEQQARQTREAAREQLAFLLGLAPSALGPGPIDKAFVLPAPLEPTTLVAQAWALRPDLRVCELAIEAAGERAGYERSKVLSQVAGVVDANGSGKQGFEMGPGLQLELPFFNRGQAGVARARAELERAAWDYAAVKQRIEQEVRLAHRQYTQALETHEAMRTRVLPALTDTVARAQLAFAEGEVSNLFVLEATRQLMSARSRQLDLEGAAYRAAAELDRSVGRKTVVEP